MPAQNRRMPLSCEPCRERKIRCSRAAGSAAGSPCASCIRRGIPPFECIYLRDIYSRRPPRDRERSVVHSADGGGGDGGNSPANSDLLERIRKLEAIICRGGVMDMESGRDHGNADADAHGNAVHTTTPVTTDCTSAHRGILIPSASGHERYKPHGTTWSSVLEDMLPTDGLSDDADIPFATTGLAAPGSDSLLADLPAMSHCDELKDVYFGVFAPLFHVLHDPSFATEYGRFRDNPSAAPHAWLALLYAVLGVAVLALDEGSALLRNLGWSSGSSATPGAAAAQSVAMLTARYRAAALRCLEADHYLWRHNLHTLQALILLVYGINHSHGQSWALLGTTRNIALALGCHVDPDALLGAGSSIRLDRVAAEQRRRCWAALAMLYTIQNSTLGHLDPAPLRSAGVRLPLDVDDVQLGMDLDGADLGLANDTAASHGPHRRGRPSQMSYLLYKFRLYDICARITEHVFASTSISENAAATVERLDAEIMAHRLECSQRYQSDTAGSSCLPPAHHTMHLHILLGYSHQLQLLLHRPVVQSGTHPPTAGSASTSTSYNATRRHASRTRCLESAAALLALHQMLSDTDAFRPFGWYTCGLASFHAFHAAVFFVSVCMAHMAARLAPHPDNHDDVLSDRQAEALRSQLDKALAVFESLAATGMSHICERAAPVLRRLLQSPLVTRIPGPLHEAFVSHVAPSPPSQYGALHSLTPPLSSTAEGSRIWLDESMLAADTTDASDASDATAAQPPFQPQLEAVLGSLQLQQWLSPSSMNWNDWDLFMNTTC